jgi:hypothetical protein
MGMGKKQPRKLIVYGAVRRMCRLLLSAKDGTVCRAFLGKLRELSDNFEIFDVIAGSYGVKTRFLKRFH